MLLIKSAKLLRISYSELPSHMTNKHDVVQNLWDFYGKLKIQAMTLLKQPNEQNIGLHLSDFAQQVKSFISQLESIDTQKTNELDI